MQPPPVEGDVLTERGEAEERVRGGEIGQAGATFEKTHMLSIRVMSLEVFKRAGDGFRKKRRRRFARHQRRRAERREIRHRANLGMHVET